MRYLGFATDYDDTLARDGTVEPESIDALRALKAAGRRLLLVTGRELEDLARVFEPLDLFDRIVVENGALVHDPATRETRAIAPPPPPAFADALAARGVSPLSRGHVIVATWEPHEAVVLDTIRQLGLELQVIFNKGAVMVLPAGVNKATGLRAALLELGLSPHNVVGIGDAENDHAFLELCECRAAVANALPALKTRADIVTVGVASAGVRELIADLIERDLSDLEPRLARHDIPLGTAGDHPVTVHAYGPTVLVTGGSGAGKSSLTTAFLEQLAERTYQFCLIDPEGDYDMFEDAVILGDANSTPSVEEVLQVVAAADRNVIVNLVATAVHDRPALYRALIARLRSFRREHGRPHWIVVDELHHVLPATPGPDPPELGDSGHTMFLIAVEPERVVKPMLECVDTLIGVGPAAEKPTRAFAAAVGRPLLSWPDVSQNAAALWTLKDATPPRVFTPQQPSGERRRHQRKYAEGDLGVARSFVFTGPEGKLRLRAQNLMLFLQLGEGVDEDTWQFHLRRGDYSQWVHEVLKDPDLAEGIAAVERDQQLSASASRARIREQIEQRYRPPA